MGVTNNDTLKVFQFNMNKRDKKFMFFSSVF